MSFTFANKEGTQRDNIPQKMNGWHSKFNRFPPRGHLHGGQLHEMRVDLVLKFLRVRLQLTCQLLRLGPSPHWIRVDGVEQDLGSVRGCLVTTLMCFGQLKELQLGCMGMPILALCVCLHWHLFGDGRGAAQNTSVLGWLRRSGGQR